MAYTNKDLTTYLTNNKTWINAKSISILTPEQRTWLVKKFMETGSIPKEYFNSWFNEVKLPTITWTNSVPTNPVPTSPASNSTFSDKIESTTPNNPKWVLWTVKTNLWDISNTNAVIDKFENTWQEFEDRTNNTALLNKATAESYWQQEQDIIKQRDADKLSRINASEQNLAKRESDYNTNQEKRRLDAEKLFKTQQDIAWRNSNIWASEAWASWLQLSWWALEDLRSDITSKYWQNISSAEQFKLTTNMSIDEALKNTWLEIFQKQDAINKFKDNLDDAQFQPILNALVKAQEWDLQAIKDINTFYTWFLNKKAEEEYNKVSQTERFINEQKMWDSADWETKVKMVEAELAKLPWFEAVAKLIPSVIIKAWETLEDAKARIMYDAAMLLQSNEINKIIAWWVAAWTLKESALPQSYLNEQNAIEWSQWRSGKSWEDISESVEEMLKDTWNITVEEKGDDTITSIDEFKKAWANVNNLVKLLKSKWIDWTIVWNAVEWTENWIRYRWTIDSAWNPDKQKIETPKETQWSTSSNVSYTLNTGDKTNLDKIIAMWWAKINEAISSIQNSTKYSQEVKNNYIAYLKTWLNKPDTTPTTTPVKKVPVNWELKNVSDLYENLKSKWYTSLVNNWNDVTWIWTDWIRYKWTVLPTWYANAVKITTPTTTTTTTTSTPVVNKPVTSTYTISANDKVSLDKMKKLWQAKIKEAISLINWNNSYTKERKDAYIKYLNS